MFNLRHCIHYIRYIHYIQLATCLIRVSGKTHSILQHTATHCDTLRHTATHCNTLQHTATHCNTLHFSKHAVFWLFVWKTACLRRFNFHRRPPTFGPCCVAFTTIAKRASRTPPPLAILHLMWSVPSPSPSSAHSFFRCLSLSIARKRRASQTPPPVWGVVCVAVCVACVAVCVDYRGKGVTNPSFSGDFCTLCGQLSLPLPLPLPLFRFSFLFLCLSSKKKGCHELLLLRGG